MYIYNTTFSIKDTLTDKGIKYIKTEYIPDLLDDGFHNPLLMKIHSTQNDGYTNYAVQLLAPSLDFISEWKEKNEKEYNRDLSIRFGENILSFSSVMETI